MPGKPSLFRHLLLLGIPLVWCLLSHIGSLRFLENLWLDSRFQFLGERDAPVKLIYVDIDNEAIQAYRWPWNHRRYAQLVDALFEHGKVKAIGFDIVFSENAKADFGIQEQNEGRKLFGKSIHRYKNVVLAANYVPGPGLIQKKRQFPWIFDGFTDPSKNDTPELPAFPVLGPTWGIPGLIDTYQAETRLAPAFADSPVGAFYPLSLQLALIHWGLTPEAIHRFPDRMEIRRPDGGTLTRIPLQRGQLIEANWFSRWISPKNPRCSVVDIGKNLTLLESEKPSEQTIGREFFAQFQDTIILVGGVDPLLQDLGKTPFNNEPVPQVGFHGNLLKTYVSGNYPWRLPAWQNHLLTLSLSALVVFLCLLHEWDRSHPKLMALSLVILYVLTTFLIFKSHHLVLPIAAPLGATLLSGLTAISWQLIDEQRSKHKIKSLFGTYVSPQLVAQIIESGSTPKLGGHEAEITCFFSDIQDFSKFSELLTPNKLVELINEYLSSCTEVILSQGAALDKYIGDAIVAMFGGLVPLNDHAYRACAASLEIELRLQELREKWKSEGGKWPDIVHRLQCRTGLNSGRVTIGNMGSPSRFNFTMMGDNVNLAARMESGAKAYGVFKLVTEATFLECRQHGGDRIIFRNLDKIIVKGRTQPVSIYEIIGFNDAVNPHTLECIERFSRGLECYQAMDWKNAENHFHQSALLEAQQPDQTRPHIINPSLVMITRCAALRQSPPPPDWDGVFQMKGK